VAICTYDTWNGCAVPKSLPEYLFAIHLQVSSQTAVEY